ncbi:maternal embryonic leucine zipper kinase-like [Fukomys damarensis]|uniref:maternal embryonic leucine zipper kinase-like n=1 Tax=Fukomys damarensis TaxID=885580 RepID=UPI0008FF1655|nr:maternal embryonic leucine zipper kinase-like [Fukomys damarensis]
MAMSEVALVGVASSALARWVCDITGACLNITQLLEVIETKDRVQLVLEYMMGLNLWEEIIQSKKQRLQEKDAGRIFRDILGVVDYCHQQVQSHESNSMDMDVLPMADQPHGRKPHTVEKICSWHRCWRHSGPRTVVRALQTPEVRGQC